MKGQHFFLQALKHQKWVWIIAMAVLMMFWGVLQHTLSQGLHRSLNEQEQRNAELLHALEDSVVRSFQSVNAALLVLSDQVTPTDNDALQRVFLDQLRTAPQLRSIEFTDQQGRVLASSGRHLVSVSHMSVSAGLSFELSGQSSASRIDNACFERLREDALLEFWIDTPSSGRFPGDPFAGRTPHRYISFCRAVRSAQGDLTGFLVAALNPQYFTNLFESVVKEQNAVVQLFRYDGEPLIYAESASQHMHFLARVREQAWGNYRITSAQDNDGILLSYRSTSELPLIVTTESRESVALQAWQRDERMLLVLMLVLSAMIVLVTLLMLIILERRARAEDDNRLLSTAIRSAANAVFITDKQGNIQWTNDAFSRLTGYCFNDVKGANPRILNSGQHSSEFFKTLWQTIMSGQSWRGELINRHRDGHDIIVEQTITPIASTGGEINHYVAVHEDVTARKQAEKQALYLAGHDPLTGLPNRRFFEQTLYDLMSSEPSRSLSIMFIDLDRFKEINDTMGHEAGDDLLVFVSDKLGRLLGDDHLLSRLGGDEFAVLVCRSLGHHELSELAEDIVSVVAQPFVYKDSSFTVTCSLGIAEGHAGNQDVSQILRQADMAMYKAKHEGKNTFCFFDDSMDKLMRRRVFLQQQLEKAVTNDDELSLRYQPQVCAISGKVVGAEALLRWETESGEWISPAEFIGLAEETGLIMDVSNWLMESMFRQIAQWNQQGIDFGVISMNVSAVQLARENLAEHLERLMTQFDVSENQLSVEITETTLMADSDQVKDNLNRLKQAGLSLAIDDFGTGYSSLSYLKDIDADYLKIDRSFVIGIGLHHSDERIVEATIALAKGLKMRVVAEGVDDEQQLRFLQSLGCDVIQGYLYSEPLLAENFVRFVTRYNKADALL